MRRIATSCRWAIADRRCEQSICSPRHHRSVTAEPAMRRENLLLQVLTDPARVTRLRVEEWELLLSQARSAKLTARLANRFDEALSALIPARVRRQFDASRLV